jgi:hypothetical protein
MISMVPTEEVDLSQYTGSVQYDLEADAVIGPMEIQGSALDLLSEFMRADHTFCLHDMLKGFVLECRAAPYILVVEHVCEPRESDERISQVLSGNDPFLEHRCKEFRHERRTH